MKEHKVLVTGASGFIAQHCISSLMAKGYAVRGTLRDLGRAEEVEAAVNKPDGVLELCVADLTSDAGWPEAASDCTFILHVASPFPPEQPEDANELIGPARDGTLRILDAARKAGVKRVVMTSSVAAIMGDPSKPTDYVYDDTDWTDTTHPEVTPYEKSKTIAEEAAWKDVQQHGGPELVTILPGAVLGPLLSPDYSTSADLVRLLMQRAMPACPRIAFNCIDVRDVAAAHIAAMTASNASGQRYICAIEPIWVQEIAMILDQQYGSKGWQIPTRNLPDILVRIGALFDPTLKRIRASIGRAHHLNNAKMTLDLGISPRGNKAMVLAMAESLVDRGIVKN